MQHFGPRLLKSLLGHHSLNITVSMVPMISRTGSMGGGWAGRRREVGVHVAREHEGKLK